MPRRELPEVNAGSMADIAFTLLIFFLVTTTLATDKGEKVLLPPWQENPDEIDTSIEVNERNVLALQIRKDGSLVLESNDFSYEKLTEETKVFLLNNRKNPLYSDSYDDAIVNIVYHPEAPYRKYLETYSNVKAAFSQIRDDYARQKYNGKTYDQLADNPSDQSQEFAKEVRKKFPLKIAEKEEEVK